MGSLRRFNPNPMESQMTTRFAPHVLIAALLLVHVFIVAKIAGVL